MGRVGWGVGEGWGGREWGGGEGGGGSGGGVKVVDSVRREEGRAEGGEDGKVKEKWRKE